MLMRSLPTGEIVVIEEEKAFYLALGQRIARLRKEQNITQVQLAETLGIAQQTMAHYEVGRLRVSVVTMPILAKALGVTVEELIGEEVQYAKGKRGPTSILQRQIEQIGLMPKTKQKFIIEMLDAMITQQQASN
jgi:transcriptional regulator with XRE-family HTH domain